MKRQALDGVLPGFVRVAGAVLDALEGREHLEYHEAAVAAGLEGHEVQPYLHLLRRIRMVRGMPSADGILMHVSRVF